MAAEDAVIAIGLGGLVLAVAALVALLRTEPPPNRFAAIEKAHDDLRQFYLDTPVEELGNLLYLDWLGKEWKPHRPFPEEPPKFPPYIDAVDEAGQMVHFIGTAETGMWSGVWWPKEKYYADYQWSAGKWSAKRAAFEAAWRAWEP